MRTIYISLRITDLEWTAMSDQMGTRERLLEAAISIIEADGEDGLRVDRVAELAGFTKPVVYHHFADREDLVVAALGERYLRSLGYSLEDIKFAAARCRTADQLTQILCQAIKEFGSRQGIERRRLRIEALGAAVSRPALQASLAEASRRQYAALAEVLEIANEEGWLRVDVETRDLAVWWSGLILSRHLVEIDPEHFDAAEWDTITEWVVRSMFVES